MVVARLRKRNRHNGPFQILTKRQFLLPGELRVFSPAATFITPRDDNFSQEINLPRPKSS